MISYLNVQRRFKFDGPPPDAHSFDITLRTGSVFMPMVLVQAPTAFDLTLFGGDRVTIATAVNPTSVLPISVEWMLHGGVVANCNPSFDDLEIAATATSLKGATLAAAAERSGALFTIEGGLFNAYLLRGRVISLPAPGLMDITVTMTVLRAPSTGGGVTVQVGGMAG
jgi:hypothetical protein